MTVLTIYATASGAILRQVTLFRSDAAACDAQCGPGESWLTGAADAATQEVRGGVIVARDPGVIEAEAIARAWIDLRATRARMLAACDWTQAPDAPVDTAAWAAYRQALRDLPGLTTDPRAPLWPAPPSPTPPAPA